MASDDMDRQLADGVADGRITRLAVVSAYARCAEIARGVAGAGEDMP